MNNSKLEICHILRVATNLPLKIKIHMMHVVDVILPGVNALK